ncbi:MAG TPA: hypothetical protein VHF47_08340, partial [Acidimicrobiales bacterium]|nr:hypothetical protein [Acidimicrobiales bacterium]
MPRLLLLDAGVEPPEPIDCLEDWVRLPAEDGDIRGRITAIARRSALHAEPLPELDTDGVLRYGPRWVPLPPVEV